MKRIIPYLPIPSVAVVHATLNKTKAPIFMEPLMNKIGMVNKARTKYHWEYLMPDLWLLIEVLEPHEIKSAEWMIRTFERQVVAWDIKELEFNKP